MSIISPITCAYIKEKWQHAGFQKYLRNTGWSFLNRIFGMVLAFFVTAIVARYLGSTKYGILSYAISFVGLFSFIASLGIDQVIYRDIIKFPEKEKEFLGTAFFLKIISGLITTAIIIVFTIFFIKEDLEQKLILIISFSYIFQSFNTTSYAFQARAQNKYLSYITIVVTIILSALKILVVVFNKGVLFLGAIMVIEPILYSFFFAITYSKLYGSIKNWLFSLDTAKKILTESLPLMLSSIFVIIYSRIDQVMLKNFIDVKAVGIYDAAVRLSEVWYFIPGIVVSSLFPSIISAQKISKQLYHERILKLTLFLLFMSSLIAFISTIFAKPIIQLIFGGDFISGYTVLQLYVWSGIGISLGSVIIQYLITEKLASIILYISLIGMILNITLNLLLIPKYGINGSAFATLVSYIIGPLSVVIFRNPRNKIVGMFKS